jgi:hypothetical protein
MHNNNNNNNERTSQLINNNTPKKDNIYFFQPSRIPKMIKPSRQKSGVLSKNPDFLSDFLVGLCRVKTTPVAVRREIMQNYSGKTAIAEALWKNEGYGAN